ncbi:MAG: ABC transporter ATP-binding protein [Lachnospirales bacterium]
MNKKTVKRLFGYIGTYKASLILILICILVSSMATAISAVFIQVLIDDYIMPILAMSSPVFNELLKALCILGSIYIVGVIASWLYNFLLVTVAQRTLKKIRDEMFSKMQYFPVGYFDSNTHGDIMSHYTNDTDTLRQFIAQSLGQITASCVTVVTLFVSMLYQSVYLTIIAVIGIIAINFFVKTLSKKIGKYFFKQQQTLGALNGYVEEMINGQKVVKVFCHENASIEEFKEKNAEWYDAAVNANGNANTLMPVMNGFGYIQYVVIAVVGSYMAIKGSTNLTIVGTNIVTVGMIASFLMISRNFTMTIGQVANQFNAIVTAMAGATRIFELLDIQPEVDEGFVTLTNVKNENGNLVESENQGDDFGWKYPHGDGKVEYRKLEGDIVLDSVDFAYSEDKQILYDVSVYAKPGQKIAFVGATGAGKTTITNLINRFYDIADGKIRYDGININKIKKYDLRKSIGVVLQDVNLFTGTVMENIRYGNDLATDEDCIDAAKLANADDFIRMLPKGYDTLLENNGGGLSQGQRQLISIARAAVSNPPVMILDEATSSIDTRSEKLVQEGMDRLMEGRTVFVIAHRLSTIMNSDVIMVLDQGRIIERGNHDELIEKGGVYYSLHTGALEID